MNNIFIGLKIEIVKYLTYIDYMKLVKSLKSYRVLDNNELFELFKGDNKVESIDFECQEEEGPIFVFFGYEDEEHIHDKMTVDIYMEYFQAYVYIHKKMYVKDITYGSKTYTRKDDFKHHIYKLYSVTNLKKFYQFLKNNEYLK